MIENTLSTAPSLVSLLQSRFGFQSFRLYQEEVCKTVTEGRDVLLVMPTGAGKSLCYQLPCLARGGTAIVISPLLALIEDQVEKLKRAGTIADRIHSGRKREESRQVCFDYLNGKLNFLFIAPERFSVPGFIEMLKKRPPSLIAVDEAHCISQWGHDFRPDYRLLGDKLKELRPAPIIALTATATPMVQDDICTQLGLQGELKSIHGFRRNNIAIQIAESSVSERLQMIQSILKQNERLPAIIYAPTRKLADQLQGELKSHFKTGIYHAGMVPGERDENQRLFLLGELDVIVATIAFGMGIDKADIRTVIHAGLSGTVEGYYQEIGRAGRDGKPSQAILLHSFADQRTHDFFFERDYPESSVLKSIYQKLTDQKNPKDLLIHEFPTLTPDNFEKALEKLWVHKGAVIDFDENISKGSPDWEKTYIDQRKYKQKQAGQMIEFTRSYECRMLSLVRHFGDQNDSGSSCQICDICVPSNARSFQETRCLSLPEQQIVIQILGILAGEQYRAAGRLFQELSEQNPNLQRREMENLLDLLARSQWIEVTQETFLKDGESVAYRKISLTSHGRSVKGNEISQLQISDRKTSSKKSRSSASKKTTTRTKPSVISNKLVDAVKEWRRSEAKKRGIPAFRILSDRVLLELCEELPQDERSLLGIKGIGPKLNQLYGKVILNLIEKNG